MNQNLDLIHAAKHGDKQAFARLYETCYQDLYRFAVYTLKNCQDAEDVVSETFIAAYEQIGKLRVEAAFRGWIFKILANRCKRKLKEYVYKTVEIPEDLAAVGPDTDEQIHTRMAFARLTDEERMIISMHIFAGFNSTETGKILKMSSNTVRSKESRALKKMQKILEE